MLRLTYDKGEEGDKAADDSAPGLVCLPEEVQVFEIKHGLIIN